MYVIANRKIASVVRINRVYVNGSFLLSLCTPMGSYIMAAGIERHCLPNHTNLCGVHQVQNNMPRSHVLSHS